MKIATSFLLLVGIAVGSFAQGPTAERQQFIRVEAPVVVLTHVRIIDGTGAEARDDQTIVIADGKIQSIGPGAPANLLANAQTVDLRGCTVPGSDPASRSNQPRHHFNSTPAVPWCDCIAARNLPS